MELVSTSVSIKMSSTEILHQAIVNRDLETITKILKEYQDWKVTDDNGETVLHLALKIKKQSMSNQKAIVQILEIFIPDYLSINVKNAAGQTVLFLAVENRLRHVIDYLVQHGANLNIRDRRGNSIIHILIEDQYKRYPKNTSSDLLECVEQDDINFMTWLLSKGVDVDVQNNDGKTAFTLAVERSLKYIIPTLMKYMNDGNYFDESGCTIIELFFKERLNENCNTDFSQDIDIVKFFLEEGVSVEHVDKKGNTLFHTYLKLYDRNPVITQCMLQHYTQVNAQDQDGNTALNLAIKKSIDAYSGEHKKHSIDVVRTLLSRGADVHLKNNIGETIVQQAFRVTHAGVLQALLEYGADLSPAGNPLGLFLHDISNVPNIEDELWAPMVDTLVQAGWNVNAVRPSDGFTPLMAACKYSCPAIAQRLIDNGANVNYVEKENLTRPIHIAAMDIDCVAIVIKTETFFKMLAKAGAKINEKNRNGQTALHLASHCSYDTVRRLLKLGAHVDTRDNAGRLPLYEAVRIENIGAVKAMLNFGAEVNDAGVLRILNRKMSSPFRIRTTVMDCLTEHWLMLKAAGLPALDGFNDFAKKDRLQQFHDKCLTEVETLKTHYLNDQTTLYDLLHMNVNLKYVFIEKMLMELVKSSSLETNFPKYHVLITAYYHKAAARSPLIEPAKRAWNCLTGINLPDCVERILVYLDNEDLRVMAEEEEDVNSLKRPSQLTLEDPTKRQRLE